MEKRIKLSLMIILFMTSTTTAWANPGANAEVDISYGRGTVGNSDQSITSRAMHVTSLSFLFGWNFGMIEPYLNAEYAYLSQAENASSVNQQNLSGNETLLGTGVRLNFEKFLFSVGYNFSSTYKLEKKTTGGLSSSYGDGAGVAASAGYRLNPQSSVFFRYRNLDYKSNSLDGEKSDISDNKVNHSVISLGISYSFL